MAASVQKYIELCKRASAMKYEKYHVGLAIVLSEYHALGLGPIVTEYE
jgi:hypothetical protein